MTIQKFQEIEKEIIELIEKTLDDVESKSFSDYILLLAKAHYDEMLKKHPTLSPYRIENGIDDFVDYTRQKFYTSYLNNYRKSLLESVHYGIEKQEYNYNIQLMIYIQIWESNVFLKQLCQIASILNEQKYIWEPKLSPKKNFFTKIVKQLKQANSPLYKYINNTYDSCIRNAIAHSTYNIDTENNCIIFFSQNLSSSNSVSFFDWDEIFLYSVLICYHLSHSISIRKKTCTGKIFKVKIPLINSNSQLTVHITAETIDNHTEFSKVKGLPNP